jgi:DNA-binding NarL/FixJ family response regulator
MSSSTPCVTRPSAVLVIDDEESVGRSVRLHFSAWTVVQVFSLQTAALAVDVTEDLRLVLLDLNMADTAYPEPIADNPFQGSFALANEIRRKRPTLPVVIFSAHCNGAITNAAHRAGAEFVWKHDSAENLQLLSQRLALADRAGGWKPVPYLMWLQEHRGMTPRESEVATLAVQGVSRYADIADHLGISQNTVKRHISALLGRAGVDSLFDFVHQARSIGD